MANLALLHLSHFSRHVCIEHLSLEVPQSYNVRFNQNFCFRLHTHFLTLFASTSYLWHAMCTIHSCTFILQGYKAPTLRFLLILCFTRKTTIHVTPSLPLPKSGIKTSNFFHWAGLDIVSKIRNEIHSWTFIQCVMSYFASFSNQLFPSKWLCLFWQKYTGCPHPQNSCSFKWNSSHCLKSAILYCSKLANCHLPLISRNLLSRVGNISWKLDGATK